MPLVAGTWRAVTLGEACADLILARCVEAIDHVRQRVDHAAGVFTGLFGSWLLVSMDSVRRPKYDPNSDLDPTRPARRRRGATWRHQSRRRIGQLPCTVEKDRGFVEPLHGFHFRPGHEHMLGIAPVVRESLPTTVSERSVVSMWVVCRNVRVPLEANCDCAPLLLSLKLPPEGV